VPSLTPEQELEMSPKRAVSNSIEQSVRSLKAGGITEKKAFGKIRKSHWSRVPADSNLRGTHQQIKRWSWQGEKKKNGYNDLIGAKNQNFDFIGSSDFKKHAKNKEIY